MEFPSRSVFNTPELIAAVFSYLDFNSLLTLQRLNRATYNEVQQNREFQLALCFSVEKRPSAEPHTVADDDPNPLCGPTTCLPYRWLPPENFSPHSFASSSLGHLSNIPNSNAWLRKEASWQRMHVSRRPITCFQFVIALCYPNSSVATKWRVLCPFTPVQLNTINDLMNGWCSSSTEIELDHTHPIEEPGNLALFEGDPNKVTAIFPGQAPGEIEANTEKYAAEFEEIIRDSGLRIRLRFHRDPANPENLTLSRNGQNISDEPDKLATQIMAGIGTLPGMTVRQTPLTKPGFEVILPARREDANAPPRREPEDTPVPNTSPTA